MRIAVISDVHGNVVALDAVLRDAEQHDVSHFWVLGDLVAHGPRPAEVLDRMRSLPQLTCVRGNTDRYVLTGDLAGMIPPIHRPRTPEQFEVLANAKVSFAWTRGCLVASGQYDWLQALPVEERSKLPDGTRVLIVHASPGRDDGPGLQPDMGDDELATKGFTEAAADVVLVGHTHVAGERRASGAHLVNPGSVSLPPTPDDKARWALVTANGDGYAVEFLAATYALDDVMLDLESQHHPSRDWLRAKMHSPVDT